MKRDSVPTYKISKNGLNSYCRVLSKELEKEGYGSRILANCADPGIFSSYSIVLFVCSHSKLYLDANGYDCLPVIILSFE